MSDNNAPAPAAWLRRLLFVEAPASTPVPDKTAHADFVLSVLLRRRRGRSRAQFLRRLEQHICATLAAGDYGLTALRLLSGVRMAAIPRFFLQLTRSHAYVAWLCGISGKPGPPPYRVSYGALYDAVLHLKFAETPNRERLDAVLHLLAESTGGDAEREIISSDRQYTIYDARSPSDERARVSICFLVNRPPGMSRAACQRYWRNEHADLALRNMRYLGLTRYLQVHTVEKPADGLTDDLDGVVYAEKSSLTRLLLDLMKPDSFRFNNTVVMDETNFTFCTPIMLLKVLRSW